MERETTACFTGLSVSKLSRPADDIKVDLENRIFEAIRNGRRIFIIGMEEGTNLWAGKIIARLKRDRFPELKLIAAVLVPLFGEKTDPVWKEAYMDVLKASDIVEKTGRSNDPDAQLKRNIWMVDHSTLVIAVYDGKAGVERNTLLYAKGKKIMVYYIDG